MPVSSSKSRLIYGKVTKKLQTFAWSFPLTNLNYYITVPLKDRTFGASSAFVVTVTVLEKAPFAAAL